MNAYSSFVSFSLCMEQLVVGMPALNCRVLHQADMTRLATELVCGVHLLVSRVIN